MPSFTDVAACVDQISALLRYSRDQLGSLSAALRAILCQCDAFDRPLTLTELGSLTERIDTVLAGSQRWASGCGVALEPGLLAEGELYLAWRRLDEQGSTRVACVELDRTHERYYDYRHMAWFSRPRATGRSTAYGPHVDLYGTDAYVLTLAAPIEHDQRFVGVAAADLPLDQLEPMLTRSLLRLPVPALVISSHGRVLASNRARWLAGELAGELINDVRVRTYSLDEELDLRLLCLPHEA